MEYPVKAENYELNTILDEQHGDIVYRASVKNREDLSQVCVKIMNLDRCDVHLDDVVRELNTMNTLQHENVANVYTNCVDGTNLWIVMPLYSGGSCRKIMTDLCPNGFRDERVIATIVKGILEALQYLHGDKKIHRDVKCGNVFVTADGVVKLADFGVMAIISESKKNTTFVGTPCWMAPEVIEQVQMKSGYDEKADIWSLGISTLELGYGVPPHAQYERLKAMVKILKDDPPTADMYNEPNRRFSSSYHRFVAKCLRKNSKKRPTAAELLRSSFITKYAMDSAYLKENTVDVLPPRHIDGVIKLNEPSKVQPLGESVDDEDVNDVNHVINDERNVTIDENHASIDSHTETPPPPTSSDDGVASSGDTQSQTVQIGRFIVQQGTHPKTK